MDNRTALILGVLVVGFFAADLMFLDWNAHLFVGKKFVVLVDKMAFWR